MSTDGIFKGDTGGTYDVATRTVAGKEVQAVESPASGTLANGATVTVDDTDTELVAANPLRRGLIVENRGTVTVRVGTTGVTYPTGHSLAAGAQEAFSEPYCPTNAVHAICDTGLTATVFVQEVTG